MISSLVFWLPNHVIWEALDQHARSEAEPQEQWGTSLFDYGKYEACPTCHFGPVWAWTRDRSQDSAGAGCRFFGVYPLLGGF